MGMFCQRWLVIYMTDNGPASKVIVEPNDEPKLPYGVEDSYIADDCERIVAIVDLPDDYEPIVVMDDQAVDVQLPDGDEDEEDAG